MAATSPLRVLDPPTPARQSVAVRSRAWPAPTQESSQSLAASVYAVNIHVMIDRTRVSGFDWDEGNARKSADKQGVTQAEAEQAFFNELLLLVPDVKHSRQEPRYHALSRTDGGRLLHITFTLRAAGNLIRVISARDMHRNERNFYEQAAKDAT